MLARYQAIWPLMGLLLLLADAGAEGPPSTTGEVEAHPPEPRVSSQPISDVAHKGLAYLASQQHEDGGWGQGGGWRGGGGGNARLAEENSPDPSDLGNTCMALLALIRAGSTPGRGPHQQHIEKGIRFVFDEVEKAESETLYVTSVRDTQLQRKIGQFADTFLAGLVLSELKGYLPSDGENKRLASALTKVVQKIEAYQQQDGTFAGNQGWASVLSQGLCSKFLNRAAQQGLSVRSEVLRRDFEQSVVSLGGPKAGGSTATSVATLAGRVGQRNISREPAGAGAGDAGVDLYRQAANAGRINFYYGTARNAEQRAQQILSDDSASEDAKRGARDELSRVAQVRGAQHQAVSGMIEKLDDKRFVAGFGNNGGEEFLSYMNISETLVQQGGEKWQAWDKAISARLAQAQNGDGSWSGQHCITGRTFCTAAALLTLLADRAPQQLAEQLATQP